MVVLRVVGWLVRLMRGGSGDRQMDRIAAAAKRVLKEQQTGRSHIPITQGKPQRSSSSQQRQHAQNQPRHGETQNARPVSAVIRRRNTAGEPVIQRRR